MSADASQLAQLGVDLTTSSGRLKPQARAAVHKTARDIEADAKHMAPVRTGNLRNSITATTTDLAGVAEAVIGPTAEYGAYVEFGTSRQSPQPYLGPAADNRLPGLEDALAEIGANIL